MERTDIKIGDIVQHFKRELLFDKNNARKHQKEKNGYLVNQGYSGI